MSAKSIFDAVQRLAWPVGAALAVVAFGIQPLLPFVDPSDFYDVIIWTAVVIFASAIAGLAGRPIVLIAAIVPGIVVVNMFVSVMTSAQAASRYTDAVCAKLQATMLSRSDDQAVARYEAMKCRNQELDSSCKTVRRPRLTWPGDTPPLLPPT